VTDTALDMFAVRVEHDPDAVFLLTPDGAGRTYGELAGRVARLAAAIRDAGASPGDVVGLYLANDPAWVVAVMACWWSGCAFAACGTLSPPEEARGRFALASPPVVLTTAELTGPWAVVGITTEGEAAGSGPAPPRASPDPDDIAAVYFTSGTTAAPKGIVHTHRRLAEGARTTASAYARDPGFRPRVAPGERPPAISFNPFGHMAGLGRMIFRMYVGRSLLLVPKFDVGVMRDLAARYPLDTLQLTPAMVHALAFTDEDVGLGSLRYITSGTAPLPIATREAFERRYGVPVLQAYGSTEGGITALERYDDAVAGRRGPGSVGRVPEGCPLRIVDEGGRDVPPGGEGEILGRPDPARAGRVLTGDGPEMLPVDADGWYHTGDVGRVDEHGILYVTGRLKEMLIVGGFNVFPAEVEDVLRRSDLVRDAVAVPAPDDRLGEIPVAGVVWAEGAPHDVDALIAHCRAALAAYKVPRRWFTLDALPLTPNGKLDRRRAADMAAVAGPAPVSGHPAARDSGG